ncbi:MAG: hypothetical protein M3255_01445, partial [Pseudomonadota bacterium]|nr:hypothetical protein [Pseudomonadota bacterium]
HHHDLHPHPSAGWPGRSESLGRSRRLIFILSCLAAIEELPVITTILLSDDYSKPPFCRNNLHATSLDFTTASNR